MRTASKTALLIVSLTVFACTPGDNLPEAGSAANVPALPTGLWEEGTAGVIDSTAEWTNKVELADLDGDGLLDLVFANGGNYSEPGTPEMNRAFFNGGAGRPFIQRSVEVFGPEPDISRVIKARDLNGDGLVDLFVGGTYQARNRLYMGTGDGRFTEEPGRIPSRLSSTGDAEAGDADGDGDLDLLLADWGPGNNMTNAGGRTRLWLNDGTGRFRDATDERMPETLVRFSWDVEWVDVDNDFDLDILVSCKRCGGSSLFLNDGNGTFTENSRGLPQYTNNYEFEAMDLDGDGFLDLVTINDGEIVNGSGGNRREHVFRNDGEGRYRDMTDSWWPDAENIGEDDNVVAFLDYDSDGDADFLIGSLSGPDRLLINDGSGGLRVAVDVFSGLDTPGTLGMAVGDLDGDGRLDVVQAQGEVEDAEQERIYWGRGLEVDRGAPVIGPISAEPDGDAILVRARVHDRKSPLLPTEWRTVEVRAVVDGEPVIRPMAWYGEYLWRALLPANATAIQVCAEDATGNSACQAG